MNILFLCHRIPFPPNKGDRIRSFNEIKFLSKNHAIHLGTILNDEFEEEHLQKLRPYCKDIHAAQCSGRFVPLKSLFTGKPFSVSNFYYRSLQKYVNDLLGEKKVDAVICFCSSMAEYIFQSRLFKKNRLTGIKLIMDYVDLDSDKWRQYSKNCGWVKRFVFKLENRRLFKYEKKIYRAFHHSIFVAQREMDVFKKLYEEVEDVTIIPNGVDFDFFTSRSSTSKNGSVLLFTGVMDYFANEDGVAWFCEKIFPIVRAELPDAQFFIVGNNPSNRVWNLSEIDGVTVTGYVEDIREYYWMADICVTPLRIARGLQNKVIEAMASGSAVVATPNASEGIICHDKEDISIANDADTFAMEVIRLLKDGAERKKIGGKARQNIKRNYSWELNLKAFNTILRYE